MNTGFTKEEINEADEGSLSAMICDLDASTQELDELLSEEETLLHIAKERMKEIEANYED